MTASFNLGIEMLFVSRSSQEYATTVASDDMFQSRNRDAFRFKLCFSRWSEPFSRQVSISESRCFSFQD